YARVTSRALPMTLLLRVSAALLISFVAYPTFAATAVFKTEQRGLTASASGLGFDGNCLVTLFRVDASDTRATGNPGPPDKAITVTVGIQQFDLCSSEVLAGVGSIPVTAKQFAIKNDLNSARLLATVPVVDNSSGHSIDVALDLSWVAAGLADAAHI